MRNKTREISIGGVKIGAGHPIAVQSMTNTKTEHVEDTVEQIQKLTQAGCDIVRVAVPTMEAAKAVSEIKKQITIPLVADIHFDYKLAIAAVENGADKIRINPGNIGSEDRIRAVVDKPGEKYSDPGGCQQRFPGEAAAGEIWRCNAGGAGRKCVGQSTDY